MNEALKVNGYVRFSIRIILSIGIAMLFYIGTISVDRAWADETVVVVINCPEERSKSVMLKPSQYKVSVKIGDGCVCSDDGPEELKKAVIDGNPNPIVGVYDLIKMEGSLSHSYSGKFYCYTKEQYNNFVELYRKKD